MEKSPNLNYYEIFSKYGREKEKLILILYEGMISYKLGDFNKSKEKFKGLIESKEKLTINDFILSCIHYLQILIDQGTSSEKSIKDIFKILLEHFINLEEEKKEIYFNLILFNLFIYD